MQQFVVHYGEIGLKGKNRALFEKQLVRNIQKVIKGEVKRVSGRLLLKTSDRKAPEKLARVFGIVNFSPAWNCKSNLKEIKKAALDILKKKGGSFKIDTRRDWKGFPLNSMEVNERVGEEIVKKLGLKVNLTKPKNRLSIEILKDVTLLYLTKIPGPGGLPVGVSGKVVCLLSGGIDSPVAGWMAMKRGCEVIFLHFWNEAMGGKGKIEELMKILRSWQPEARLIVIPFRDIQNQVIAKVPAEWRMIVYRRLMFRIAQAIAKKAGAKALVTGESLAQVASQTLDNMVVIEEASEMPVFRPLIGLDKQEIINLAKKIGTYDISIKPYQDCCSFMIAKHPITKARIEQVRKIEQPLDIQKLVKEVVKNVS